MSYWWLARVAVGADGGDRGGTGVLRVGGGGVVLEAARGGGCSRASVAGDGEVVVLRRQPVVPLALMTVRSKPPWKKPQVMLAALSRSPMLGPVMWTRASEVLEQTSPAGSASPMRV